MKEQELREHATCSLCLKPVGHTGLPLFWKLTAERYCVNLRAVQRQDGLGALLGSTALAQIMGPDEELAAPVQQPVVITLCEKCALENGLPLAAMKMIEVEVEKGRTG